MENDQKIPETLEEKWMKNRQLNKERSKLNRRDSADNEPPAKRQDSSENEMVRIMPKKMPQEVLAEMDELVGMADAKGDARALLLRSHFDAARGRAGFKTQKQAQHTVFTGNPGTGKTTMARHRAELLHALGLAGNRYIEISRENMVGKFIGHTEARMVEIFGSADVIFIDEAYNLVSEKDDKKDFGNRVIDALMTALENRREDLTIFFAGYPEKMQEFLTSNPGLQSRITHYQHMPDYSHDELGEIMNRGLKKAELEMTDDARQYVMEGLQNIKQALGSESFGNARIMRTIVEQLPTRMAERLFSEAGDEMTSDVTVRERSREELKTVTKADVEGIVLIQHRPAKNTHVKPARRIGFTAEPE